MKSLEIDLTKYSKKISFFTNIHFSTICQESVISSRCFMKKSGFRKRRKDQDKLSVQLLPLELFPRDSVIDEFQGRRISNILIDFASPYITKIPEGNFMQFKIMLYVAALAWNFSYFKTKEDRQTALVNFIQGQPIFNESNKEGWFNIVEVLGARKNSDFWQHNYVIGRLDVIKGEAESAVVAEAVPYTLIDLPASYGVSVEDK